MVEEIKLRSLENCLEFCRKDCRERSVSELLVSSLLLHLQLMLFISKSFSPNVNERRARVKASVFCLLMLILFSFLAKTRWCFLIPSLFWINSKAFCGRETSPHLQSFSSLFPKVAFFFKIYELAVFIFIRALDDLEDLWTFTCKLNEGLFSSTKGATMWIRSGLIGGSLSSEGNPRYFPLLRVLFIHYTDEAYTRGGLCL